MSVEMSFVPPNSHRSDHRSDIGEGSDTQEAISPSQIDIKTAVVSHNHLQLESLSTTRTLVIPNVENNFIFVRVKAAGYRLS